MNLLPSKLDPLSILYEDHHLIAVNKASPLLTQAPEGVPSLEFQVKAYIKEKYAKPAGVYLGVPHRLDRGVSGVVVFTRNTKASQRIHAQFAERRTEKVYWAILEGEPSEPEGVWVDWMVKRAEEARVERGEPDSPGAKRAELRYRVMDRIAAGVLVELKPLTGRSHQLRAQSAWRGLPIAGDFQYGSTQSFGPTAELPRDRVIALHARQLTVLHPFQSVTLTWTAPLPDFWPKIG